MAFKKIDDAQLTTVADAIRIKGGTSDPIVFPDGFVSAIQAIEAKTGNEYQFVRGNITADEPTMDFFFEDIPFMPEGAFIYHTAGNNAAYYIAGEKLLLFGIGTIAGQNNVGLAWERRLAAAARLETTSFFVLWHDNMLVLTCEGYFNGPYSYMIWGKSAS